MYEGSRCMTSWWYAGFMGRLQRVVLEIYLAAFLSFFCTVVVFHLHGARYRRENLAAWVWKSRAIPTSSEISMETRLKKVTTGIYLNGNPWNGEQSWVWVRSWINFKPSHRPINNIQCNLVRMHLHKICIKWIVLWDFYIFIDLINTIQETSNRHIYKTVCIGAFLCLLDDCLKNKVRIKQSCWLYFSIFWLNSIFFLLQLLNPDFYPHTSSTCVSGHSWVIHLCVLYSIKPWRRKAVQTDEPSVTDGNHRWEPKH